LPLIRRWLCPQLRRRSLEIGLFWNRMPFTKQSGLLVEEERWEILNDPKTMGFKVFKLFNALFLVLRDELRERVTSHV
jgi:hypothetical protein